MDFKQSGEYVQRPEVVGGQGQEFCLSKGCPALIHNHTAGFTTVRKEALGTQLEGLTTKVSEKVTQLLTPPRADG